MSSFSLEDHKLSKHRTLGNEDLGTIDAKIRG